LEKIRKVGKPQVSLLFNNFLIVFHKDPLKHKARSLPDGGSGPSSPYFPYSFLLKTIRNLLPRAQDPPGPFSLQFLLTNIKEFAPESSGSSLLHFPCKSLLTSITKNTKKVDHLGGCDHIYIYIYMHIYIYICMYYTSNSIRKTNLTRYHGIGEVPG
jgi:hypothetical protein